MSAINTISGYYWVKFYNIGEICFSAGRFPGAICAERESQTNEGGEEPDGFDADWEIVRVDFETTEAAVAFTAGRSRPLSAEEIDDHLDWTGQNDDDDA
ncbi:hypothetical protein SLNSH_06675 [Alsobacter soli]|uniref:Uncharacterized protein n=1 Tax=Alsobacter soli TaxID=2109933 RepID=A0A2T1HVG8_9HYPH|nr:hypothetical protein [Alsobacter soli]PSC05662.1 hypothetical protein SLNSH_06675 [Alsobacter soli]